MNFRRLVSAVAALAVAGTCVVTSGVSVLAADTETLVATETFDNGAPTQKAWQSLASSGTYSVLQEGDDNYYLSWVANAGGNPRAFYIELGDDFSVDTSKERVTFDFAGWAYTYTTAGYYLLDSNLNEILSLTYPAGTSAATSTSGSLYINGTAVDGFTYSKECYTGITWYTFDATLNFKTLTFDYKIYPQGDSDNVVASNEGEDSISFSSSATDFSNIGFYHPKAASGAILLDNVSVYSIQSSSTTYNVTISYEDEDGYSVGELTEKTIEVEAGSNLNLANYYDETVYYDAYKYTYKECDVDGTALTSTTLEDVAADTDVTVVYNKGKRNTYTPTVQAYDSSGNTIDDLTYTASETYEDLTATVYYPAYILASDGKYYSTTARATDSTYPWFAYVVSYSESPITRTYSESNIYYYVEAEDMNIDGDAATAQSSYYTGRCSLGAGINLGDSTVAYTDAISDGAIYTVNIAGRNKNQSDSSLVVFLRDPDTGEYTDAVETLTWGNSATATKPATVYVPAGYQVAISGVSQAASGVDIDYVTLTKVATAMTAVDFSDTAYTLSAGSYDAVDGGTPLTITETQAVNTYLIKISNYVSGVPTITLEDGTTITPTEGMEYGYSANGYKYFMIQTLDIDSAPASVTFGDVTIDADKFGELTAE